MTHEPSDKALDALFAEASREEPGPDLMARVLADAEAVQAEQAAGMAAATAPRGSWLAGIINGLGGWSAVSGITAAGVMGLAVGLYSPDAVSALLESDSLSLGTTAYDFTPDVGDLWTEDGDV